MRYLQYIAVLLLITGVTIAVFVVQIQQKIQQHAAGTGQFHIVMNRIIDPSGNPFVVKGADMVYGRFAGGDSGGFGLTNYNNAAHDLDTLKAMGGNAIRLSLSLTQVNTNNQWNEVDTVIALATQRNMVVIMSQVDTGNTTASGLQTLATRYKTNPYVWIKPANEPHGGTQSWTAWQQEETTWVQAIRAGGNTAPIVLNSPGWSWQWAQYPQFKINDANIILGPHIYANGSQSFTPSSVDWASLSSMYPVIVDEVGNDDVGAANPSGSATWNQQFLTFVANWIQNNSGAGCLAFNWHWSDGNSMTDGNGNLNAWGQAYQTYFLTPLASLITATHPTSSPTTLSLTPQVTATIQPTNPSNRTSFSITVCPHGLGNCGDNAKPGSGGNASPQHTTPTITLTLLNQNNQPVAVGQGTVTYNASAQNMQGIIAVANIASGQYLVSVKLDGYLSKQLPGIISVTANQAVTLPGVALVTGDINNDNQLDISDYNLLISCFGSKQTTSTCTTPPTSSSGSDINDDGVVDGADYNLFLRELSTQKGTGGPTPTPPVTNTPTPTQVPSPTAPSGTKQTITAYGWGGSAAYQPAGSPWTVMNDAWGGPPPNTQAIDYYPNNFPNFTTLRWSYGGSGGNVLGYPEIVVGDQNGQTVRSANGVEPVWYGKTLGSLSRFVISWDIVINAQNGDNWDILFENHMSGHETGIFIKDLGHYVAGNVSRGTHFSNLGGMSGYGIPSLWAQGSFAIIPDSVAAGTPMLKGSIDLLPIFKWAISNGWMSSNESVYGWEFGVEPTNGSGSVTFNSLSVDIQ